MRIVYQNILVQAKEKDPNDPKKTIVVPKIVRTKNELSHFSGTVINFNFTCSQAFMREHPHQCYVLWEEHRKLEDKYHRLAKKYLAKLIS